MSSYSASVEGSETAAPASHLIRLPGTGWCLWRTIAVRAAGFSASMVDELAAPRAAAAADALLAARARGAEQRGLVLRQLAADLRRGSAADRRRLREIRRRVLAGEAVDPADGTDVAAAAAAVAAEARAEESFREAYEADTHVLHGRLDELSREPRLREAMLWQSAEATRRIWESLRPGGRPRYHRRALTQVAMRVQRYCVKNDAIGFFGPFGWAHVDEQAGRVESTPGPELTAAREVYFEGWCVDALAAALDAAHPLRPWLSPRIKAGIWIQGGRAWRPLRRVLPLGDAEQAVLALCDGDRTAREIARLLATRAAIPALTSEAAVFAVLDQLVAADVVSWRLDLAPQVYPERELRARLVKIEDPPLRDACLSALDDLLGARARVAAAAGQPEALDTALAALDDTFVRLTAQPASRRGGQTYAGRTLVYEDCRRDGDVRIGPELLAELSPALGPVLDAARWISAEIGQILRAHLRERLAELQQAHGPEIDCHQFLCYVMQTVWMQQKRATLFDETLVRFQRMWAYVLGDIPDRSVRCHELPLADVRARAAEMFPARTVTWSLGRYVSPDLQIAAPSAEAIRRGEYLAVLGEVHLGNTMGASTYTTQHPRPAELYAAAAADTGGGTVVIRSFPRPAWIARTNYGLVIPQYWRYVFGDDPPCHPPCRELPAAKLVVRDTGESVVVQARDGSLRFDAVELFANSLMDEASDLVSEFRVREPHLPRLTLGRLVMARERWTMTAGDIPVGFATDPARQFAELRAWRDARGLPRRVFAKCPAERKPWFLDFDSPLYVEISAAIIRKLSPDTPVSMSEMLPDLEQLWLHGPRGERYTSELRCVTRPAE